jgi:AcrR family transcriptional regulator
MTVKKRADRRVQRTRRLLQEALLSLMVEKGYEAITVQDIIDRADLGRATFYAHFADKGTLLASGVEDLRTVLLEQQRERLAGGGRHEPELGFARAMLEHANGRLPLWRAIAGRESGALVIRRIHDMLAELVRRDLAAVGAARSSVPAELLVQHLTGAFIGVMTWWLDKGTELSAEQVDAIYRRLATRGLRAL